MYYEVNVKCVICEPITTRFFCVLETLDGNYMVPINVSESGAESIFVELNEIVPPRPMTFDFISGILSAIDDVKLEKVLIYDVEDCVFKTKISINHNGLVKEIECRASDAIALGLRIKAPIFIDEKLLNYKKCICKRSLDQKGKKVLEEILVDQRNISNH
ncbi:MAG: bifunctional nuclease family protein [Deferribacterota bacterium]|nr:bifunctional nuclease family protein [Deferribacterota bacterium]